MPGESRLNLRLAIPADARDIAAVHVASWRSAYRGILPDEFLDGLSIEERAVRWDQRLRDATLTTWIADIDRRIIGFANVSASRDDHAADTTGELLGLYVSPDRWRQGVGRSLCRVALSTLGELGFHDVTAWVLADNARARAFYGQIGMKLDGGERIDIFGGCEVREVRYRLPLEAGC